MRRTLLYTLLLALAAGTTCCLTATAQADTAPQQSSAPPAQTDAPPATPKPKHMDSNPHREMKKLSKDLSLTSDQQAKIEPIITSRDQQVQALEADTTLAPKQQKKQMRSAKLAADAQIEAVLTDAQKTQYEQMKANKGGKHSAIPAAGDPSSPQTPPPPAPQ